MAGDAGEAPADEVAGGLLSAALCATGSALALLALPSLFGLGTGVFGLTTLAAAGGGGLLLSGVGLSLVAPPVGKGGVSSPAPPASRTEALGPGPV